MNEPFERVSRWNPSVPDPLAKLIAQAVELDPKKRFQTAGELIAALDAVLKQSPSDVDSDVRRFLVERLGPAALDEPAQLSDADVNDGAETAGVGRHRKAQRQTRARRRVLLAVQTISDVAPTVASGKRAAPALAQQAAPGSQARLAKIVGRDPRVELHGPTQLALPALPPGERSQRSFVEAHPRCSAADRR